MVDPEREFDDDDDMTEAEVAAFKVRMQARGHLNPDGTLNKEAILADSDLFEEFEDWYQAQHTGEAASD